jgi:hypothetical protein
VTIRNAYGVFGATKIAFSISINENKEDEKESKQNKKESEI